MRGFTLIEMLVVIAIIGILIGLSGAAYQSSKQSARDTERKATLQDVRSSLEIYRTDCGVYPTGTFLLYQWTLRGTGATSSCSTNNTYIDRPTDPLDPTRSGSRYYRYSSADGLTYQICAGLENVRSPTVTCGTSNACGTGGAATCTWRVTQQQQ